MAITVTPYLPFLTRQINGNAVDFDTDTLKVAILTDYYTPDTDTHDFFDDVSTYELANGDGYTTGGLTLGSVAVTANTTDNRIEIDYADLEWTFTASKALRYLVIYKSTGTNSTSALIALIDMGVERNESAGLYIKIPTTGLFHIRSVVTSLG